MLKWKICKDLSGKQWEFLELLDEKDIRYIRVKYPAIKFDMNDFVIRSFSGFIMTMSNKQFSSFFAEEDMSEEDCILWRTLSVGWRSEYETCQSCLKVVKKCLDLSSINITNYFRVYTNPYGAEFVLRKTDTGYDMLNVRTNTVTSFNQSRFDELELYLDIENAHRIYIIAGEYETIVLPAQIRELFCVGQVRIHGSIFTESEIFSVIGDSLFIEQHEKLYPLIGNIKESMKTQVIPQVFVTRFDYEPKDKQFKWGVPHLPNWFISDNFVMQMGRRFI